MGKNKNKKRIKSEDGGLVYSTNKDVMNNLLEGLSDLLNEEEKTSDKNSGKKIILKLRIEKKGRSGKTVTIISGLENEFTAEELAKNVKNKFGIGGSVKDGEIILQGDIREKLRTYLQNEGYGVRG